MFILVFLLNPMNPVTLKNIEKVSLKGDETILFALKQMDILERKLLIIIRDGKFIGLLSIGDIQRAIIKNLSLDTQIIEIIRDDIRVTYVDDDMENVKAEMLEHRIECMPILDRNNNLADVLFWEDVFGIEKKRIEDKIDIPVVIMAGGEGSRLRPLTCDLPKPMVPVMNIPIMEHIIELLGKRRNSN